MGWSFMHDRSYDKPRLVEYLISREFNGRSHTVLKHALVGNHLWTVVEVTREGELPYRFIGLHLLQSGGTTSGWGYKSLCESQGLYEVDCPLGMFDLVREAPASEASKGWRDAVRKHHALKSRARKVAVPGLEVTIGEQAYILRSPRGRKGWLVERASDGVNFRASASQVAAAVRQLLEEQSVGEAAVEPGETQLEPQQMVLAA